MTDPVQLIHNESQNKQTNKNLSQAEKPEIIYLVLPLCKEIGAQISVPDPKLQAKVRVEKRTPVPVDTSPDIHSACPNLHGDYDVIAQRLCGPTSRTLEPSLCSSTAF